MAELIGGRYEIERVLGTGAMGVVYRAHDTVLDRTVALKELTAPAGMDPDEAVERFLTEARAGARLRHPAIVIIHDVLGEGDRVLMAMELLEGPTLGEALTAAGGGLPADVVRGVMGQVAGALAEAHGAGVVHRDLKPENIFWLPSGRVVVCDFGLARIGAGGGTRVGTVMGTPGYLAPEQVRGQRAGPAADVFSWGAVTYELLTGAPAFGDAMAEDPATLIWRVVNEDPAPLRLPDDPDLADLVAWCLAKEPDERPADGFALVEALGGEMAIPTVLPSGSRIPSRTRSLSPRRPTGVRSPGNRKSLVGIVLATVLVVLAVVVAAVLIGGRGADEVRVSGPNQRSEDFNVDVGRTDVTSSGFSTTTTPGILPSASREQMRQDIEQVLLDFHLDIVSEDFQGAWALLSERKRQQSLSDTGYDGWVTNQTTLGRYLRPVGLRVEIQSLDPSNGEARIVATGMSWTQPGAKCAEWSGITWAKYEAGHWRYDPGYATTPTRETEWKPRYSELMGVRCAGS